MSLPAQDWWCLRIPSLEFSFSSPLTASMVRRAATRRPGRYAELVKALTLRDIKTCVFCLTRNLYRVGKSHALPLAVSWRYVFSTCRTGPTRSSSPCVFCWHVVLCSHVRRVPNCSGASVLHLRLATSDA